MSEPVCEVPGCDNPAAGEVCETHGMLAASHEAAVRFVQTTRAVRRLRSRLAHEQARLEPTRRLLTAAEGELLAAADVLRGVDAP